MFALYLMPVGERVFISTPDLDPVGKSHAFFSTNSGRQSIPGMSYQQWYGMAWCLGHRDDPLCTGQDSAKPSLLGPVVQMIHGNAPLSKKPYAS
jgi:hypothetical protein